MDDTRSPSIPPVQAGDIRTFSHFLGVHEEGALDHELTEALRETVAELNQHVIDHGGKPKASIGVEFHFLMENGVLDVVATIKKKLPTPPRGKAVYWATPANGLTQRNPRQGEFALRDVTATSAPLKSV